MARSSGHEKRRASTTRECFFSAGAAQRHRRAGPPSAAALARPVRGQGQHQRAGRGAALRARRGLGRRDRPRDPGNATAHCRARSASISSPSSPATCSPTPRRSRARRAATSTRRARSASRRCSRRVDSPRQEFFRRLNLAPGATAQIVAMRRDLLDCARADRMRRRRRATCSTVLTSWFNRGFLVLRRIDWQTPAAILEKIIALRGRARDQGLGRPAPPPRSGRPALLCLLPSLAHRRAADLRRGRADAATSRPTSRTCCRRRARTASRGEQPTTAVFYSISNCQEGLRGISFGNFLIKQVVEELASENAEPQDLRHAVAGAAVRRLAGATSWTTASRAC